MTPPALALRLFLPSTSGINGLVAVSQNAAPLYAVMPQIAHLLVLAVAYGVLAFVLWKRTARKIHAEKGGELCAFGGYRRGGAARRARKHHGQIHVVDEDEKPALLE